MEQVSNKFASALQWDYFGHGLEGDYSHLTKLDESGNEIVVSRISLNPISIAGALSGLAFVLVFAGAAAQLADYASGYSSVFFHKLVKVFSLDLEQNLPSFFSMLLLFFTALLLGFIAFLKRKQKAPFLFEWTVLSIGFLFMTFDEATQIHEKLIEPMRAVLGGKNLGIFYYAWVVPAIVLVSFLSVFFLKFLWSLPTKSRITFIAAGIIYIGGALGMELIGGSYAEIHGRGNLVYILMTTVEESLEMFGVIVFIWGLLKYIADSYRKIDIQFGRHLETAPNSGNIRNVAEKILLANR